MSKMDRLFTAFTFLSGLGILLLIFTGFLSSQSDYYIILAKNEVDNIQSQQIMDLQEATLNDDSTLRHTDSLFQSDLDKISDFKATSKRYEMAQNISYVIVIFVFFVSFVLSGVFRYHYKSEQ